ncbi:sensor histidine kinase [Actinoplanes sp. KI2]|uniref:sensor histidine kinase n=1 Tax=Actinoplanes sp. KI2 TaxID=2983315 RepID=UPI0021D60637|nr:sensor histidine kinase [Actinoplanes sp. KI2]MCU7730341.1 sensor histidine kinase [Actinoplanes sp. KI2]
MEETRPWGPPWRQDRRTGRFHPRVGVGAAVVAGFFQVVGANNAAAEGGVFRPMTPLVYALLLIGPCALLWRWRFPVAAFVVSGAASLVFATFSAPRWTIAVAPGIALFNLAKRGHARAAIGCAGVGYAAYLAVCWVFADRLGVPADARADLRSAVLLAVGFAVLIFLGGAAKVRGEHMAEMMKVRAERARVKQEQERRQASEERLRIARELHDVLGHHLSLINVQAGVGLHLMDSRPEQAREALAAIKTASAEALREVRTVLDVMRADDEAAPRQPAVSLNRLGDLTADAGLPITTKVTGDERPLPPEVDRAAYRIVQEALTNVRKHAGAGATASIAVDYLPTALHLAIRNEGPAVETGDATPGEGTGIAGMRERAQSLGGSVEAGPVEGGFLVSVLLPTPDDPPRPDRHYDYDHDLEGGRAG